MKPENSTQFDTQTADGWHDWHGHVRERPDGIRMRCGGEKFCSTCQEERRAVHAEQVQTIDETDLPVGTRKINTGYGVNNYVPPTVPVQGALSRLLATNEEHENG